MDKDRDGGDTHDSVDTHDAAHDEEAVAEVPAPVEEMDGENRKVGDDDVGKSSSGSSSSSSSSSRSSSGSSSKRAQGIIRMKMLDGVRKVITPSRVANIIDGGAAFSGYGSAIRRNSLTSSPSSLSSSPPTPPTPPTSKVRFKFGNTVLDDP